MSETSQSGACHCGTVQFTARLARGLATASRCDCSFCRMRGAVAVTAEAIDIHRGREALTLYQFGSFTARHFFCAKCGIYTHHRRRSNPDECGVNLGAIEGVLPWEMEPLPYSDGINHPSDRKGD